MEKSKCHKAPILTSFGEEGTNCYICTECNKPCDIICSACFIGTTEISQKKSFLDKLLDKLKTPH